MRCPNCGSENPRENKFCDSCGTKLINEQAKAQSQPAEPKPAATTMAASSQPAPPVAGPTTVWWTAENLMWVALFAVSALLLFLNLGEKPLHHDESLHAYYSWELFKGMGYQYNPMMHGPLLFHFNALAYYLFGASDFSCRIVPALMGMLTLTMIYFLRDHLGKYGALFTAVMIVISPSFTYFGRFIRNDIYVAAFTLMMVYGLLNYLLKKKNSYLYLSAIGLGLSFSTKENTYITGAIIFTFLLFRWLWENTTNPAGDLKMIEGLKRLWTKPEGQQTLFGMTVPQTGWLDKLMRSSNMPFVIGMALFFGIVLVLYTTVFTNPKGFIDAFTASLSYWIGQHEVQRGSQPVYFYAGLIPLYETLALLGAVAGLIYYSFIKFKEGRAMRLVAYLILGAAWWLFAIQGNETFGLIFSLLLVVLGSGMLAYFSFGLNNMFITFLLLWTVSAFSDYSFAGERMPWLILHPLLPMILLTGTLLGELWQNYIRKRALIMTIFVVLGSMMLHNTVLVNFYGGGANPAELLVYVQSSTDVPQVVKQLKNMSKRLKGNLEMKITCEDYCSWPFAWYLRDFKYVGYPKYTATQAEGTIEKNPIIISGVEMAAPGHDDRVAQLLAEDYVAQRYKLRVWWAPDARAFFNDSWSGKLKKAWRLFFYKEPWSGLGSYDMIVYIRKDVEHLYWSNAD